MQAGTHPVKQAFVHVEVAMLVLKFLQRDLQQL